MLENLSRYWWLVALRGVFAILFGILAFLWPGMTVSALVILFGAYAIVDGVSNIITSIKNRDNNDRWWALLLEGVFSVLAGIVAFVWTGITAVFLLYIIAVWAIITGIFEIIAAVRLRQEIENEWALGLSGLASIIFGLLLVFNPGAGALAVVWLIASYAILFGGLLIYLAFQLRKAAPNATATPQSI